MHRRLLAAIVLGEYQRIAQTKIAGEGDNFHARRQLRRDFHSLAVGQCKKCAIDIFESVESFRRFDKLQISNAEEILVNFTDSFAGLLVRSYELNVSIGMLEQNAQQFRSSIA